MYHSLKIACYITTAFLVIYLFFGFVSDKKRQQIILKDASGLKLNKNFNITGLPSSCKLPEMNPWNEEIMPFVDLDYRLDSKTSSFHSFIETSLENRTVSAKFSRFGHGSCSGRCIFKKTEFTNSYGKWQSIEEKFDCDLVHIKCKFYLFYLLPFNYERVHAQIVPVKRNISTTKEKKYNIFVILIDATAHGQSYRNLPKTLFLMKERFSAVTFPYSNKVASNSRPNGFPLFLGKSLESFGNHPPDLDDHSVCQEPMDGFQTILDDMHDAGYKTLYSDDYPANFFNLPNCSGFRRNIADHSLSPLIREISIDNPKLRTKYKLIETFRIPNSARVALLLNFFEQFIVSYENEPKFGWIWSTDLSHDKQSTSIALDEMLYKMLIKRQNELDNSYVFIMGDHGLHFGPEQLTETAKLDLNNPMLTFSIPKALRTDNVRKTILENTKHLVTHYDTRATWLDIAKYQVNDVIESTKMRIPGEKGESYLRKQTEDRTCQNLPIPPVYCICEMEKEDLPKNSSDALIMAKRIIMEVNNHIAITLKEQSFFCGEWKLAEVISLKGVKPVEKTGVYFITVRASEPYDKALFSTIISVKPSGELAVGAIERKDRYEHRGDCSVIPRYCHCI